MIRILESRAMEMMERKKDLFSSRVDSDPSHPFSDSDGWKEVVDRCAEENKQLKAQIERLVGKRQCVERSSSAFPS